MKNVEAMRMNAIIKISQNCNFPDCFRIESLWAWVMGYCGFELGKITVALIFGIMYNQEQ